MRDIRDAFEKYILSWYDEDKSCLEIGSFDMCNDQNVQGQWMGWSLK